MLNFDLHDNDCEKDRPPDSHSPDDKDGLRFTLRSNAAPQVVSMKQHFSLLAVLIFAGACASAASSSVSAGRPDLRDATVREVLPLLPVPRISGATLAIRVQYPSDNQIITSRDSNFVLGVVGSGDARLTINGFPVDVAPNGSFIGWLPNPAAAAPRYDLVAVRDADTARGRVTIRYPVRRLLPANGALRVDSSSVIPGRGLRVGMNEFVRVGVRAPFNATVSVESDDGSKRRVPPARTSLPTPTSSTQDDAATFFVTDVPARVLAAGARLVIARNADTVRLTLPAPSVMRSDVRTLGMLKTSVTAGSDTDRTVNARTIPDGTYKWLLFPGTVLEITGARGGFTRVKLDETLEVWVDSGDITALPDGSASAARVTSGFRVLPDVGWVDLVIPMGEKPAFIVEPDFEKLTLTLYGVQANPEISPIIGNDTLIRRMNWEQVTSDRVRITLSLSHPVYGWLSLWDEHRRAFVLRVRRPPVIADVTRPLAGLTIAVDPGHPPAGATGPSGLYEGDAVLPVGLLVAEMLKSRGAQVVMTRTTKDAVGLTERGVTARRGNANAFVSIHLNALPDGVNPFVNNGTSTLFFNGSSEPLARALQFELMPRLGLRDLGVHYQNLAVARPSWYPAALTEGAFLMMPDQEAAMRNPAYIRRYAEGIVAGLERYFRELRGR